MNMIITQHGLTLQHQPTPTTCVQTCLAIALGVPVADVLRVFGEQAMNQQALCVALTRCGVLWNQFIHMNSGWHFVVVPSLNKRGGLHQVLIHYEWDTGLTVLFDPATATTYADDGSDLVSWSDLTPFHPGGRLP